MFVPFSLRMWHIYISSIWSGTFIICTLNSLLFLKTAYYSSSQYTGSGLITQVLIIILPPMWFLVKVLNLYWL